MAKVEKDGKFGYIDMTGREVAPAIYDSAEYYPEKDAVIIETNGKVGYIEVFLDNKSN